MRQNVISYYRAAFCLKTFSFAVLFFGVFVTRVNAQQEWGFTQYLFNLYDINSAYAGNHSTSSFALRYRSQWNSIEGRPISQNLSWHAPAFGERMGVGVRILHEEIGARRQFMGKVSGAYKIKLGDEGKISAGLAFGFVRQDFNLNKLTSYDAQDPILLSGLNTQTTPLVDFSVMYNTNRAYVGIESSRINRSAYNFSEQSLARLYYNVNLVAGIMKKLDEDDLFQLSTLVKVSEGKLWQAELNFLYLKNNKFWLGVGYRWKNNYNILACLNLTTHLRFGMSFEMLSSNLIRGQRSSEFFLGYNLGNKSGKSIRYF
jgi:type IX secretion system PorP/SprF family membrane protein